MEEGDLDRVAVPGSRPGGATRDEHDDGSLSARVVVTNMAQISPARRRIAAIAQELLGEERAADVELCVSELATNAVTHGDGSGATLQCRPTPRGLQVVVTNGAERFSDVRVRRAGPTEPTGRGLAIVNALADRVSVTRQRDIVSVECRFDRT